MSDGTSVWAQLASSQMVQYGVPYIDPSLLVPAIDTGASGQTLNFGYYPLAPNTAFAGVGVLSVGTFGDLTGTDPISSGGQVDSYVPVTIANQAIVGKYAGFSVSASRGSRILSTIVQPGDFIGEFGGYGLVNNGVTNLYQALTAMYCYATGASATFPGGEMRWGTRQDGGVALNVGMKLDNVQSLSLAQRMFPGLLTAGGAFQTVSALSVCTGVPSNALGSNGDFVLRSDGGAATCIYQKRAGAWVATGA